MLVEAPVLDRDRRLRHPRAHPRERDDLAVALGRDRAEQRAVGGVDERVLADPDLVQRREVAATSRRSYTAAAPATAGRDEHDDDEQQHEERPRRLRPRRAAAASGGRGEVGRPPWSPAGRAHAAMVAMVPSRSRRRPGSSRRRRRVPSPRAPRRSRVVGVPDHLPTPRSAGRRSAGCSSGAAPRSGCSRAWPSCCFDDALNPARGEWDSARLHDLGAAVDVLGPVGQRLVPADRRGRVLAGRRARRRSSRSIPLLVGRARPRPRSATTSSPACSSRSPPARPPSRCCTGSTRSGSARTAARRTVLFLAVCADVALLRRGLQRVALPRCSRWRRSSLAERGRLGWAAVAAGLALLTRSAGRRAPAGARRLRLARPSAARARSPALAVAGRALLALSRSCSRSWIGHPLAFLDAQRVVWERRLSPAGPLGGLVAGVGERRRARPRRRGRADRARRRRLAADRAPYGAVRARRASRCR